MSEGCRYTDIAHGSTESTSSVVYDWLHCAKCGLLCTPRCPIEASDVISKLMAGLPSRVPGNTEPDAADMAMTDGKDS